MSAHMPSHVAFAWGDILRKSVAACLSLGIPTQVARQTKNGFQQPVP
jgi:hypothetical protein